LLLLEGACRVQINSVLEGTDLQYSVAHITQLEPIVPPLSQRQQQQGSGLHASEGESAEVQALAKQLRDATAVLLKKLM